MKTYPCSDLNDRVFQLSDKIVKIGAIAVAVLCALIAISHAYSGRSCEEFFVGKTVSAVADTPALVKSSVTSPAADPGQNEICWRNLSVSTPALVYISSYPESGGSTSTSWPIQQGSLTAPLECHPWGNNVPIYLWAQTGGATQEVAFMWCH